MKKTMLALALACASTLAFADASDDCAAAGGSYLTGTVLSRPTFQHGRPRQGVELSHTHLKVRADQDGQVYDVAADNVYANGYDNAGSRVPAPLSTIRAGNRVELCGQLYTNGVGIHWVHSNCGADPSPSNPDGWLKLIYPDGSTSDNYEGNTEYCSLFN